MAGKSPCFNRTYCHLWNPLKYGIFTISTGAGFCPSTVHLHLWLFSPLINPNMPLIFAWICLVFIGRTHWNNGSREHFSWAPSNAGIPSMVVRGHHFNMVQPQPISMFILDASSTHVGIFQSDSRLPVYKWMVGPHTNPFHLYIFTIKYVCTPWKFNSSPLKLTAIPKGKDRLPLPSFFRGDLLNFGRVAFRRHQHRKAPRTGPEMRCGEFLPPESRLVTRPLASKRSHVLPLHRPLDPKRHSRVK